MKQLRFVSVLFILFSTVLFSQSVTGVRSVMTAQGSANVRVFSLPDLAASLTVEAWIFPMNMSESESVILRRYKNNPPDSIFVYSLDLKKLESSEFPSLVFRISDGIPANEISVNSGEVIIPFFSWTHVAGVYDGSNMKIYINGIEIASTPASIAIPTASELRIGLNILPVVNKRFFGFIDEVRHWNMALTAGQISDGMGGIESPETIPELTGYWKFEEENPAYLGPVYDSSIYGSNGEYRPGATTVLYSPYYPLGVAEIQVSPSSFNFGIFEEGEVITLPFFITNTGPVVLPGYTTGGGFVLQPGESLDRYFSPTVNADGSLQSAQVISNASDYLIYIPAYGTVIPMKRFDINNIGLRVTRNGRIALPENDPIRGLLGGLEWPKGSSKHCLYQAGLWLGAEVDGNLFAGVSMYNTDFAAGNVVGGIPADVSNARFRTYKISRGDNASNNPDYAEWPVDLGAPVNEDGSPKIYGDQTIFTVFNDLNPIYHTAFSEYPTIPIGAEVKQIIYGYNRPGPLMNNVYIKYIITNKANFEWRNTYAALWSDIDVGDAADDFAGCVPGLNLGYTFNAQPIDGVYGDTPPSVALHYLNSPVQNTKMTMFAYYNNSQPYPVRDPNNRFEMYNYIRGMMADGNPYINPFTGQPTVFPVDGDPVTGTGWLDGIYTAPFGWGDRRMLISAGPFNLEPGNSMELDFAITVSSGANNIDAVSVMRSDADAITYAYLNPPPAIYYISANSNENGTVNPSGQVAVNEGSDITFQFIPNTNYEVKDVIVDGTPIGICDSYTFSDVRNDHSLYVAFADLTPPVITLKPPVEMWPANHKMECFKVDNIVSTVSDNIDAGISKASVVIDSVSSDEMPDVNGGDGSTNCDIKIKPDCRTVELRSERLGGGNGRVYNIFLSAADESGNIGRAVFKVTVPKNQGKNKTAVDDGPAYVVTCSCGSMNFYGAGNGETVTLIDSKPTEFTFAGYPNPFNPSAKIRYSLPENSYVEIDVYNTLGQRVTVLESSIKSAGIHEFTWNASSFTSGIYFVKIYARNESSGREFRDVRKMLLVK